MPASPPPGVSTTPPALSENEILSNRDRLAAHLTDASCADSHRLVEPFGFGFEQFDAIGRFRENQFALSFPSVDKVKSSVRRDRVPTALPVNSQASILGVSDSAFSSPDDAADILARTPACQRYIVKGVPLQRLYRAAAGKVGQCQTYRS